MVFHMTKPQKQTGGVTILLRDMLRINAMLFKKFPWRIGTIYSCVIAGSIIPFFISQTQGKIIDELILIAGSGFVSRGLLVLLGTILFFAISDQIISSVRNLSKFTFWFRMVRFIQELVYTKKTTLDIGSYENPEKKNLIQRAEEGLMQCQQYIDRQMYIFENIFQVAIASVIIFKSSIPVFFILILTTTPQLIARAWYSNKDWAIFSGYAESRRKRNKEKGYFENISTLIEIKLFRNAQIFIKNLIAMLKTEQDEYEKLENRFAIISAGTGLLAEIGFFVSVFLFTKMVIAGNTAIGEYTFLFASLSRFQNQLSMFFGRIGTQYQSALKIRDLFAFLDIVPTLKIATAQNEIILADHSTPIIEFRNVSFSYPGSERQVLKNINLTIKPGEKLAIVGVNGAGKTTFTKLLSRFYDPTDGEILIGGHDLKKINLDSWYQHIGVVFQDYGRYYYTVNRSIAAGVDHQNPNMERVLTAANQSGSDTFISQWPDEYNQQLGTEFSGGIEPSVGQWQKIALARMFYRDPRVLVLDEPTASIDAEAEAKIFDRLHSLPDDQTVILISHRFSTIRHAQRIVVIEEGEISEMGSHEELLNNNRTYARLFALQAKGYQ